MQNVHLPSITPHKSWSLSEIFFLLLSRSYFPQPLFLVCHMVGGQHGGVGRGSRSVVFFSTQSNNNVSWRGKGNRANVLPQSFLNSTVGCAALVTNWSNLRSQTRTFSFWKYLYFHLFQLMQLQKIRMFPRFPSSKQVNQQAKSLSKQKIPYLSHDVELIRLRPALPPLCRVNLIKTNPPTTIPIPLPPPAPPILASFIVMGVKLQDSGIKIRLDKGFWQPAMACLTRSKSGAFSGLSRLYCLGLPHVPASQQFIIATKMYM